ncbi:hypothetical protein [Yersinia intermedia]|nr:hypothetical protein [Yersinia intermedia]
MEQDLSLGIFQLAVMEGKLPKIDSQGIIGLI